MIEMTIFDSTWTFESETFARLVELVKQAEETNK